MVGYEMLPDDLPVPEDDGAAAHLKGAVLPDHELPATDGSSVSLGKLKGCLVLYAYPMTGRPGIALPDGWDEIPGARGCTPQSCSFRDHMAELRGAGADHVFGISTQSTIYQREAAERLHLPFPLLSDEHLEFAKSLSLPTMKADVDGQNNTLLKRLAMVVRNGKIEKVFYPVFPPEKNAANVWAWLQENMQRPG